MSTLREQLARIPRAAVTPGSIAPLFYWSDVGQFQRLLDVDQMRRAYQLLYNDPVVRRCRNLLHFCLIHKDRFEICWGSDGARVRDEFEELVRDEAHAVLDALLAFGFVPWSYRDVRNVHNQAVRWKIPLVLPFGTYAIEQAFGARFTREFKCVQPPGGAPTGINTEHYSSTRVYASPMYAPHVDGTLNSEVAALLFTHSLVASVAIDGRDASRIGARPPVVTQRRQKDGPNGSMVRSSMYLEGDMRDVRQESRMADNAEENEIAELQQDVAAGEPTVERSVDPETNRPVERSVPPFFRDNFYNIPIGRELVRQQMPEARADIVDWIRYRDDASATVLGIPASIVMPRAGSRDSAQTGAYLDTLSKTMAGYAASLSDAIEAMLTELYKRKEDEELIDLIEMDLIPASETKRILKEIQNARRYNVRITPPSFVDIELLMKIAERGYFSRETEARLVLDRAGLPHGAVEVQAPDKLLSVASQVAVAKAAERERRKTESEEQASKKPRV